METAVYLICEKNRGHQRKHIDVCRRCPSRKRCRAYRDHQQMALPLDATETPPPQPKTAVKPAPATAASPATAAPPATPATQGRQATSPGRKPRGRRPQKNARPTPSPLGVNDIMGALQAISRLMDGTPAPGRPTDVDPRPSRPLPAAAIAGLRAELQQLRRLLGDLRP